jgi:hypothetical protein
MSTLLIPTYLFAESDTGTKVSTEVNWELKKLEAQKKSSEMRKEYYEKYATK